METGMIFSIIIGGRIVINKTKKEIQLKKVVKACGESVKHWVKDILVDDKKPEARDCALCKLDWNNGYASCCASCIVHEFTSHECEDTGCDTYYDIVVILSRIDNNMPIDLKSRLKTMKTVAIKSEINFLKALKALAVERLKNEKLRNKIKSLT